MQEHQGKTISIIKILLKYLYRFRYENRWEYKKKDSPIVRFFYLYQRSL